MSLREYYQFGGYQPQIEWFNSAYDDKELSETIAGSSSILRKGNPDGPLELILGIKKSGSSHLLLTGEQTRAFGSSLKPRRGCRPAYARDFESLSPIYFETSEKLTKKLSTLKQKAGSNKSKDTSQANRGYDKDGYDPYRAAFEHGRVIHRILNDSIDASKFGVDNTSWKRGLRISSLVFNTKGVDHRNSEDRLKNPMVLDVGYCEARLPSLDANHTTAKHIINLGNSTLGGGKPKKPFNHGTSEKVAGHAMSARIREFFEEYKEKTENPMILLVYNEDLTMNYLLNLGVDTSAWRRVNGVKDLITPEDYVRRSNSPSSRRQSSNQYNNGKSRSSDYSTLPYGDHQDRYRDGVKRSRSRSPRFDGPSNSYNKPHASHPPAAQIGTTKYPPVFVLDIRKLYVKLTTNDQVIDVVDIARQFGLTDVDGFCAGNEACFMIDIWKSMVSGLPIDEQREQRKQRNGGQDQGAASFPQATPGAGPSNAGSRPLIEDSDDEQDPNDVVAPPQKAQPATSQDHYNLDESDYGSSSDSD